MHYLTVKSPLYRLSEGSINILSNLLILIYLRRDVIFTSKSDVIHCTIER